MRSLIALPSLAALLLALSGCGQRANDFSGATPDAAGLTLELQGGAAEGLPLLAMAAGVPPSAVPADGDELATIRAQVKTLNGELHRVMDRVDEAVQLNGIPAVGDRMLYGPADRCVVPDAAGTCTASATFLLGVRREREHVYSFLLEARPPGSTLAGDFRPVAAGWLARGAHGHRGVGRLALHLRNLHAVQPAYPGDGFLLAGFANGPVAKSVHYRLVEFTADGAAPLTAVFVGLKNAAGVRRVRVATAQELLAGPGGDELLLARAAWLPGVAGRTYSIVTNWERLDHTVSPPVPVAPPHGDVPGGTWDAGYYFGRACYTPATPGAALGLAFKEWFLCGRPETPAACVLRQLGAGTVVTGSGSWSDAGNCRLVAEPLELADPGDAGDTPEHPSDEPGTTGAGMQAPPSPPADQYDTDVPPAGTPGMSPLM